MEVGALAVAVANAPIGRPRLHLEHQGKGAPQADALGVALWPGPTRLPWNNRPGSLTLPVDACSLGGAGTFFRIVAVLWLVALLRIGYNAMDQADTSLVGWQSAVDFVLAVLGEFGNVGIGTAMLAMLLTRPVNWMGETAMTFYQAMVNRYVIPVIEKHKAEGRAQADEEWMAWNRRRVEAERQGRTFDEVPPRS